jgi:hypothetical protein
MKVLSSEKRSKFIERVASLGGDDGVVLGCTLADGAAIDGATRDEILTALAANKHVEIRLSVLAYSQQVGKSNRKFVRFSSGAMQSLGSSFAGMPFLRDHEQGNSLARGGTILSSKATKIADGQYEIRQEVSLTAPWAVELAVRGLLSSVSIGFRPTGPVLCSACESPVFTQCYHFPGDKLTVVDRKKVRASDGTEVVEWVYTAARGVETSGVPVPSVVEAKIEEIRASLSDALGAAIAADERALRAQEDRVMDLETLAKILGAAAPTEEAIAARAAVMNSELQLAAKDRERFAATEAELAVLRAEVSAGKRAEFLRAGIAEGRIAPADKELWSTLWDADAKRAGELMAARPPQSATPVGAKLQSAAAPAPAPPQADKGEVFDINRAAASMFGMDPDRAAAIAKELEG